MKRRPFIFLGIILILAIAGWYFYKEFNRTNKDLKKAKADYALTVSSIIKEFETNDSASSLKYNGRILELTGNVKAVETDDMSFTTVVLGNEAELSSVRCSLDTNYVGDAATVKTGSSIRIRGACTGFNRDDMGLGSDIILNRCVILKSKENN
jgi:hypothetical protein